MFDCTSYCEECGEVCHNDELGHLNHWHSMVRKLTDRTSEFFGHSWNDQEKIMVETYTCAHCNTTGTAEDGTIWRKDYLHKSCYKDFRAASGVDNPT